MLGVVASYPVRYFEYQGFTDLHCHLRTQFLTAIAADAPPIVDAGKAFSFGTGSSLACDRLHGDDLGRAVIGAMAAAQALLRVENHLGSEGFHQNRRQQSTLLQIGMDMVGHTEIFYYIWGRIITDQLRFFRGEPATDGAAQGIDILRAQTNEGCCSQIQAARTADGSAGYTDRKRTESPASPIRSG